MLEGRGTSSEPSSGRGAPEWADDGLGEAIGLRESVARFDGTTRALRLRMQPPGPPVAGLDLLEDILRVGEHVAESNEGLAFGSTQPIRFVVFEGPSSKAFGLGGNLRTLADAIERGDRAAVRRFAETASRVSHGLSDGFGVGVVTLALVRGKALGGFFEAARSCDVVIAEANASFGLPEGEFGLFPGSGAMTAIAPRVGEAAMRELVIDGKRFDAARGRAAGIVDVLAEDGGGEAALAAELAKLGARHVTAAATYRGLADARGATLARFMAEADRWVECACRLDASQLGRMRRLAAIQDAAFKRRGAA